MSQQWPPNRGPPHPQSSSGGRPSPQQGYGNQGSYAPHNGYQNYGNQPAYPQQQYQQQPYNHQMNGQRPQQGMPSPMNPRPQYVTSPVDPRYSNYPQQSYGAPPQHQYPQQYQQYPQQPYTRPMQQQQPYPHHMQQQQYGHPMQQQPQYYPPVQQQQQHAQPPMQQQQPAKLTPQQIREQRPQEEAVIVSDRRDQQPQVPQHRPEPTVLPVKEPVSPPQEQPQPPQQRPAARQEEPAKPRSEAPQYHDVPQAAERKNRTPNFPKFEMQYKHFQKHGDIPGEEAKEAINRSHLLLTNDEVNRTFVTFCKWNPLHVLDVKEIGQHEKKCIDKDIIEQLKNL